MTAPDRTMSTDPTAQNRDSRPVARLARLLRAEIMHHAYDRRVIWFCWQCDRTCGFWHRHPHHCYVLPPDAMSVTFDRGGEG